MNQLKIQHVRFCRQCRELLPTKCVKCVAHPERKPRVVALYGAPPIIGTAPCGCVKVKCQRAACGMDAWKKLKKTGQLPERNLYCSKQCHLLDINVARRVVAPMPCQECGVMAQRPPSALSPKVFFCSRQCRWVSERKRNAAVYAQRRKLDEMRKLSEQGIDGRALYYCTKCKDVTDHIQIRKKVAKSTNGWYGALRLKCQICFNYSIEAPLVTDHPQRSKI